MITIPSDKHPFFRGVYVDRVWYRYLMDLTQALNTITTIVNNTTDEQGFNLFSLASDADALALEPKPPQVPVDENNDLPQVVVPSEPIEESQMNAGLVIALCESVLQNYGLIT